MRVLHAGCGGDTLPEWMGDCEETRLDVDPRWNPHVVASFTDLGDIGPFDVAFCCHALEHLYPHEVEKALSEFRRVLGTDGKLIVFVPDLEGVSPTEDVLFVSPDGPITGLDLIYGSRKRIPTMPHMAHHSGFTWKTLLAALRRAGFGKAIVQRLSDYNLLGAARCTQ